MADWARALAEHLERHEREALTERFADVTPGLFASIYSDENRTKPLTEKGWCRVWALPQGDRIIAHTSAYDMGEGDIVYGHLGIEKEWRGHGYAARLQAERAVFLDRHGLTLCGAVAPGNVVSLKGCLANGFQVLRVDPNGSVWVYREPGARKRSSPSSILKTCAGRIAAGDTCVPAWQGK